MRRAHLVGEAPEPEVLDRALGQVLALGDALRLDPPLHQRAVQAAQPEVDGERGADRAAAHDDDLMPFTHSCSALFRLSWLLSALPHQQHRIGSFRHALPVIEIVFFEAP